MASRQKASSDDPQQGIEDEEIVSGAGEGDEIMEEAEEQEDGYSTYLSPPSFISTDSLNRHLFFIHNKK